MVRPLEIFECSVESLFVILPFGDIERIFDYLFDRTISIENGIGMDLDILIITLCIFTGMLGLGRQMGLDNLFERA